MMDETKVRIGDDVLLDIGTHSDWYISTIRYDNESVNVELRRKTERNNKWWVAEQTEPQTCSVNGRPYDCGNCEYHKCMADEPQTELVNDSPILAKDLVDDEFNPYDEECMRCKHLKLKCEFIPTYCKFESRDEPQTGRSSE